ncbi:MAG: cyclase family protein [Bryobacteraceae bacterium]|nr:cyclase family protein [Bryobacteraceae bacterium]
MSGWIDISAPLRAAMTVWPGDAAARIERVESLEQGGAYNLTRLAMSAHTGTHVDAPLHFLAGGAAIDAMPAEAMIGPARVVRVEGEAIRAGDVPDDVERGARILFRTRNSERDLFGGTFHEDYVYLARDAAEKLAQAGALLVGIDALSVSGFREDPAETHRVLLGAGVWILEGIRLGGVAPGEYELVCVPLRIEGADGAPARALLRPARRRGGA